MERASSFCTTATPSTTSARSYQWGPTGSGTPPTYQLWRLLAPYSSPLPWSDPCACTSFNLYTNSAGIAATVFSGSYSPDGLSRIVRFDGTGGTGGKAELAIPSNYIQGDGGQLGRVKLLESGVIYVAVLNYDPAVQRFEVWRFAPGETQVHTVAYAAERGLGINAWDVSQSGRLVVAETTSSAGGQYTVKLIETDGTVSTLADSAAANVTNVWINQAGLVAGIRGFADSSYELFYALPGGAATRVLGTGESLNGGTILNITGTSEMNEAGQLTIFSQLNVPVPYPVRQIVFRVDPVLPPAISGMAPDNGPVGTAVTITGTNFGGATAVAFNGTSSNFNVVSATQITATVPVGATSGPLSVTTPAGAATSTTAFTVTSGNAPTLTSFSPASGGIGSSVTIKGSDFAGTTAVRFNGTSAVFKAVKPGSRQITLAQRAARSP